MTTDNNDTSEWIACAECDALHAVVPLNQNSKAACTRCGSELYRQVDHGVDKVLAFTSTALLLLVFSNFFPFLSLQLGGRVEKIFLVSSTLEFFHQGFFELGILVFITSILFPVLVIAGLLYIILSIKLDVAMQGGYLMFRYIKKIMPWSLIGVFMLGVFIAIVKLGDIATVIPGVALFLMIALLLCLVAAVANLDERLIWQAHPVKPTVRPENLSISRHGLVRCRTCEFLTEDTMSQTEASGNRSNCPRCGEKLSHRKDNSIARTWALVITAIILYIPANVYPIMTFKSFGSGHPDTILSGVVSLIESNLWGLALLVFFASIMVPVIKLMVLSYLLVSVQKGSCWRPKDRTHLFRVTEVVGAWSMIDIFLIGILISLVKLGAFATVEVETGASFFAAVVVITIFAAHSFDSRLIWDNCKQDDSKEH